MGDNDREEAANQRPVSRSRDPSQPIRGQDEEVDMDLRIRELDGVISLGFMKICKDFIRIGCKSLQCWAQYLQRKIP